MAAVVWRAVCACGWTGVWRHKPHLVRCPRCEGLAEVTPEEWA